MDRSGPLRVVIGEDEPSSRARLRQLVTRTAGLVLVAECDTGRATLDAIIRERPSVVYLDIQMPGIDGFGVVDALGDNPPAVVFVTAHDDYAVRAFDACATDYLLKPFDDARFARSVSRVHAALTARAAANHVPPGRSDRPVIGRAGMAAVRSRLAVHVGDTVRFLETTDVTHITAEDCYSRIHTRTRTYLVREGLTSLCARVPATQFRRVHRSAMVNVAFVDLLAPVSHGDLRVRLTTGAELRVSRRYRTAVQDLRAR